MDSINNKKKFKLILALLVSAISVLTLAALAYISFFYDSTSSKLVLADSYMKAGDKDKAYELYYEIIQKDSSSEEAFLALAKLSEERGNFKDAAYFWMKSYELNSLNKDLILNMLKAAAISRGDKPFITRFAAVTDKKALGEEIMINAALSYLRTGDITEAREIAKDMSEFYSNLMDGFRFMREANFPMAEKSFSIAAELAKTETEKSYLTLGQSLYYFGTRNADEALKILQSSDNSNIMTRGDKLVIEAKILDSKGKKKEAFEKLFEASKLHRFNVMLPVEAAEIAYSMQDVEALEKVIAEADGTDKIGKIVGSYIKALKAGVQENWVETEKYLDDAKEIKGRMPARLLLVKCAIELNKPELAVQNLSGLPLSNMAENFKKNMVAALMPLLKNHQENAALCAIIYRMDPENIPVNALKMKVSFGTNKFADAIEEAKRVLKAFPNERAALAIAAMSELRLGNVDESLKYSKKMLEINPKDEEAVLFAARAYAFKNDFENTEKSYKSLLENEKFAVLSNEEFATFLLRNDKIEDFDKITSSLKSSDSPIKKSLGYALQAQKDVKLNKLDDVKADMEKAIEFAPKIETLYIFLANFLNGNDKRLDAKKVLEKGIAKTASDELEFRYILLCSEGDEKELKVALERINKLKEKHPKNANALILLANVQFKLGNTDEALMAARSAVQLAPKSPDALVSYGKVLVERKQYTEAIGAFERAHFNSNNNPIVKDLIIAALYSSLDSQLTDVQKRANLEKILKLDAEDENAQKMLKILNDKINAAPESTASF